MNELVGEWAVFPPTRGRGWPWLETKEWLDSWVHYSELDSGMLLLILVNFVQSNGPISWLFFRFTCTNKRNLKCERFWWTSIMVKRVGLFIILFYRHASTCTWNRQQVLHQQQHEIPHKKTSLPVEVSNTTAAQLDAIGKISATEISHNKK